MQDSVLHNSLVEIAIRNLFQASSRSTAGIEIDEDWISG
jgi:hypothetical protein